MKTVKITLPIPPTLNQQINIARGNRYNAAKVKKEVENVLRSRLRLVQQRFTGAVYISCLWKPKVETDPVDNLPASFKFIGDALVRCDIIKDDSPEFIKRPILHDFVEGDNTVDIWISDSPLWRITPINPYLYEFPNTD